MAFPVAMRFNWIMQCVADLRQTGSDESFALLFFYYPFNL